MVAADLRHALGDSILSSTNLGGEEISNRCAAPSVVREPAFTMVSTYLSGPINAISPQFVDFQEIDQTCIGGSRSQRE